MTAQEDDCRSAVDLLVVFTQHQPFNGSALNQQTIIFCFLNMAGYLRIRLRVARWGNPAGVAHRMEKLPG
ncbi:hypothetical protein GJ700_28035 [Duganella sp. FT92W]|uniref:Uncharacterized protein n=1 Tax=Pseudoduganella rivuli TaxID=2666085 RepID=A0A7X2LWW3_9BURK|nr:hypothetical protein [Pseudoduganella rivuli]MRV75572.1 hypothetical protein [Pseudoduganella rivuli]